MKKNKEIIVNFESFLKKVKKSTDYIYKIFLSEKSPLTEEDKKLIEISKEFGCQRDSVLKILSVLKNKDLSVKPKCFKADKNFLYGVVVLISNINSHNYNLNEPIMFIRESENLLDGLFRLDGKTGNIIPSYSSCFRKPTEEEIEKIAKIFFDETLKAIS